MFNYRVQLCTMECVSVCMQGDSDSSRWTLMKLVVLVDIVGC